MRIIYSMSESINMGIFFFLPLEILSGNSIWRFKMKWREEKMIIGVIKSPVPAIPSGIFPVMVFIYIT